MAFADIEAAITFTGFTAAEQTTILGAIETAYDGSATAKTMLDDWVDAGNDIEIEKVADAFQAFLGTGRIQIDLAYLDEANYISDDGVAVEDTPVTAIMHELVHAIESLSDDGDYVTDYRGDTVRFSNDIYDELGLPEQNSYVAYDNTGDILERDRDYTGGVSPDRSFAGETPPV